MDIATLRWELVKLNKEYASLVTWRNSARDIGTRAMLDQKLEWVDKCMEHVTSMLGAVGVDGGVYDGVCNAMDGMYGVVMDEMGNFFARSNVIARFSFNELDF